MTAPTFDEPGPKPASMTTRILVGAGGLLLLAVGVIVTVGVVLFGVAAIVVAWFVMRRRAHPLTRGRAWVIGVLATAVPLMGFFVVTMLSAPPITPAERQARAAEAARSRESMPDWMKTLTPGQQQAAPMADSIANKLLENRGFMVWAAAMGAMIGSALFGMFAGTIGWGATMLGFRAIRGDWMAKSGTFPLR
jgi:hypothetical protein